MVVDTGDDNAAMPDVISGRRTLFLAVGTVDAHVDLSGIKEGDLKVSSDGKSATLRLPEAQLENPTWTMKLPRCIAVTAECLTASLTFLGRMHRRRFSSELRPKWLLRLKSSSSASVLP